MKPLYNARNDKEEILNRQMKMLCRRMCNRDNSLPQEKQMPLEQKNLMPQVQQRVRSLPQQNGMPLVQRLLQAEEPLRCEWDEDFMNLPIAIKSLESTELNGKAFSFKLSIMLITYCTVNRHVFVQRTSNSWCWDNRSDLYWSRMCFIIVLFLKDNR